MTASTATKTPARYSLTRALKVAYAMHDEYLAATAQVDAEYRTLTPVATPSANTIATGEATAVQRETAEAARIEEVQATHVPTVAILAELDRALSFIRETHPDVPSALTLTIETGRGKKHGHFAAQSWKDTDGSGLRHEILMASESLARGAEATLTTLIHEAAHALNYATGNKDTSRQGRYHNQTFASTAANMGLILEADTKSGFATTGLNAWAKNHYAQTLANLEMVLTSYRVSVDKKAPKAPTTVRVECSCEYPVTVPIKWWNDYGIDYMLCGACMEHYSPTE